MTSDARRIPALRAALSVAPDDFDLRFLLAEALEAAGKHRDAIGELRQLLKLRPNDPGLLLKLAGAFAATGQGGQARQALQALEESGAMSAEAWRLKAAVVSLPDLDSADEEDATESPPADTGRLAETPGGEIAVATTQAADPDADRIERPAIDFNDVGGMEEIKEAIRLKIIYPNQNAELYRAYGKAPGGGLLMYGPPGCGKTHLARATAGEIGASFMSIGIADVLDMWIGSSERNLHAIFESARAHRPCILFFDEIDALAADRASFRNTAGRSVINQFLAELDGATGDNTSVLVMGATNAPWHVDSAFRRPGRFGEVLFVPPPDAAAREAILRVQVRDRPVADIDFRAMASKTDGWSGADLKGLVDRALERKLAAALRTGQISPVTTNDLSDAAKGIAPTTREWFSTVRNYLLYQNESGIYDPVRPYLKK
jgi:SpoVK/Ycf46/Vps4 family AAA+-type ATPase